MTLHSIIDEKLENLSKTLHRQIDEQDLSEQQKDKIVSLLKSIDFYIDDLETIDESKTIGNVYTSDEILRNLLYKLYYS